MSIGHRLASIVTGRRKKWAVLACWLGVFLGFGVLAGHIGTAIDNDETNWLPRDAESTAAVMVARQQFPADTTTPLVIVYARDDGGVTTGDRAVADADRLALASSAVAPIPAPSLSADHKALLLTVPIATQRLTDNGYVTSVVDHVRSVVDKQGGGGLVVSTTGPVAARADATVANGQLGGVLTLVTLGIVAALLLVTYRSPLLLVVPLLCVVIGAVVADGGAYLLSRAGLVLSGTSSFLLIVLVFGIGTDYALLLISRYREELRRHADRHEAMAFALRRTLPSVAASAVTVVLASLTLLAADMNSTRGLGAVAAVAVTAALLVMTTLLPAVLVVPGRWLLWPRVPRYGNARTEATGGLWQRIASRSARHPRRTWVLTVVVLGALTSGVAALTVGGLTSADNFTQAPESVVGQQVVDAHFPGGSTDLTDVYVLAGRAAAVAGAMASVPGVATVGRVSDSGRRAHIPVVLAAPSTSRAAEQTVVRLRAVVHHADPAGLVGGSAATALDTNQAADHDLTVIIPTVLVIVALLLGLLLRAVIAPLMLLGCAVLSTGAAIGVSALVFGAAGFAGTDQSVLLLGFLFLVALGVDYTVFLMGRAREEVAVLGHRRGVLRALATTGGVITSAGVVLAATFLVFTLTPVVLNVELGTLVAVGVLLDTLVVRSFLVPALTLDIGPAIWWPTRQGRAGTGVAEPNGGGQGVPSLPTPEA